MRRFISQLLCTWGLLASVAQAAPSARVAVSVKKSDQFLGSIAFNGGLALNQDVRLATPSLVKYFEVRVPEFCAQTEVFDAKVLVGANGFAATAVPGAKGLYAVNNGNGSFIEGIRVSLNGPLNASCSILVFAKDAVPTTGGEGNFGVACLTNATPYMVPIAVTIGLQAYQANVNPGATAIVSIPTVAGVAAVPTFIVSFDSDLSLGIANKFYTLQTRRSLSASDCTQAAQFDFRVTPTNPMFIDLYSR